MTTNALEALHRLSPQMQLAINSAQEIADKTTHLSPVAIGIVVLCGIGLAIMGLGAFLYKYDGYQREKRINRNH